MRFSIFATGFAALAASTPISAPAALDKRTVSLDAVPYGLLSRIPNLPWDQLNVNYGKLNAGSATIGDLAKLPVDVSGLAKNAFSAYPFGSYASGIIESAINAFGEFNVPIEPLNVPAEVKSALGSYTGDASIDASKIPLDVSKLPVAKAASSTVGSGYTKRTSFTKRTFADIPGLSTLFSYFGFGNILSTVDSYLAKGLTGLFTIDISKEAQTQLWGVVNQFFTGLQNCVAPGSALYNQINGGSQNSTTGYKVNARADSPDGSPAFTITAKQVSDFINFVVSIAVKVGVATAKAVADSGALSAI